MTDRKTANLARLVKKLARSRTPETEIVIESGAGSLISHRLTQAQMESTRLSMVALRQNSAARRNRSRSEPAAAPGQLSDPNGSVTIYVKPADVQSNATIRALDRLHIAYQIVDVSKNQEAQERLKGLGYMQAPVVVTDSDHWSGFRPDKIEQIANSGRGSEDFTPKRYA